MEAQLPALQIVLATAIIVVCILPASLPSPLWA